MTTPKHTPSETAAVEAVAAASGIKIPKWLLNSSAGTGIAGVILGAITWANSISTGVTRIETKLDGFSERLWRVENKVFGADDHSRRRVPVHDDAADGGSGGQ